MSYEVKLKPKSKTEEVTYKSGDLFVNKLSKTSCLYMIVTVFSGKLGTNKSFSVVNLRTGRSYMEYWSNCRDICNITEEELMKHFSRGDNDALHFKQFERIDCDFNFLEPELIGPVEINMTAEEANKSSSSENLHRMIIDLQNQVSFLQDRDVYYNDIIDSILRGLQVDLDDPDHSEIIFRRLSSLFSVSVSDSVPKGKAKVKRSPIAAEVKSKEPVEKKSIEIEDLSIHYKDDIVNDYYHCEECDKFFRDDILEFKFEERSIEHCPNCSTKMKKFSQEELSKFNLSMGVKEKRSEHF